MALALCKFVSTTSWLKHLVQLVFSLLFELLWHLRHKSFALSSWQELLHYSLLCMLLRLELFIRAWALAETSISKMLPGQVSLWKSLSPQCIHSSHKTPYHMITTVKFKTSIHCFSSSSSAPTPPHFLFRLLLSPGFLFPLVIEEISKFFLLNWLTKKDGLFSLVCIILRINKNPTSKLARVSS